MEYERRKGTHCHLLHNKDQSAYITLLHSIARRLREMERFKSTLLVIGIPNVGKSTLINRLRALGMGLGGGKAARVGDLPGMTRSVSGKIRILNDPEAFLWDTPGVLMPGEVAKKDLTKTVTSDGSFGGLKLALTGAVMDSVVGDHLLMDFLRTVLLERSNSGRLDANTAANFLKIDHIPGDTMEFIEQVARQHKCLNRNGSPNIYNTVQIALRAFRMGNLGRFTLDPIP